MNRNKEYNREEAKKLLTKAGLTWDSFNNDTHWKVNGVDLWPTTYKWLCPDTGAIVKGIESLIEYIKPKKVTVLTADQMFEIAKKVKPMSLMLVCEALHKAIYKGENNEHIQRS
jgi:hypothetical protein